MKEKKASFSPLVTETLDEIALSCLAMFAFENHTDAQTRLFYKPKGKSVSIENENGDVLAVDSFSIPQEICSIMTIGQQEDLILIMYTGE